MFRPHVLGGPMASAAHVIEARGRPIVQIVQLVVGILACLHRRNVGAARPMASLATHPEKAFLRFRCLGGQCHQMTGKTSTSIVLGMQSSQIVATEGFLAWGDIPSVLIGKVTHSKLYQFFTVDERNIRHARLSRAERILKGGDCIRLTGDRQPVPIPFSSEKNISMCNFTDWRGQFPETGAQHFVKCLCMTAPVMTLRFRRMALGAGSITHKSD